MDDHLALVVHIAVAHVWFDGQVGLTLGVVIAFRDDVCRIIEEGSSIRAFFLKLVIVDVGGAGVDFDGVRGHGLGGAHVFGQQLQIKLDLFCRSAGVAFGVRADDGKRIAILEDFGIVKDGTFPAVTLVGGEGDQAGDAVPALHVLVGQHLVHARHLFGFRGVYALDVSMGYLGLGNGEVQGVGGQTVRRVRAEFGGAGHLGDGRRTGHGGTPDAAIGRHLEGNVVQRFIAAHEGGGVHDRVHQGLVARTAADVVIFLEPVAHVFAAGIGIGIKQGLGRNDEARSAETALGRAVVNPGMLQGVQVVGGTHALKSCHGGVFRHAAHFDYAGAYNLAVKDHRAGTALTLAAANFDTGELQLIAQHVHKHIVGVSQQAPGNAVNHKGFCFHARLLLMMNKGICLRGKSAPGVRFPASYFPNGQTG